MALKSSLSLGYYLRKRIILKRRMLLVLLTAIDLGRTIINVCCVTRQYLFRIHFFASQRLPEFPSCLYNYIYLLLPSFFQISCSKIYVTLIQDYLLRLSITWQTEPAMFWSANFPRLPHQFTYILNWTREWIKISLKEKPRWPGICWNQVGTLLYWKATLPAGSFHWMRTQKFDQ